MLASLRSGRETILDALRGVSEMQCAKRPAAGKWSILECVEHLVLVEDYLFGRIIASVEVEGSTLNRRREAAIAERGRDRTKPIEAPAVARPTGRFLTLNEATNAFVASRDKTVEFVEACTDDLRARVT